MLEMNLNTVQRACTELERKGVLFTLRGQGTFVTREPEKIVAVKKSLTTELMARYAAGMEEIDYSEPEIFSRLRNFFKERKNP